MNSTDSPTYVAENSGVYLGMQCEDGKEAFAVLGSQRTCLPAGTGVSRGIGVNRLLLESVARSYVSFFECLEKIELYCSKETTSKCCGEQNICLLFQCLPFCTTYFQRLISFMLVHAGFVFTYTPVAAGPLRGQDARKVLLEADRLFSKNPPSPPL